jgi:hypothetical protein
MTSSVGFAQAKKFKILGEFVHFCVKRKFGIRLEISTGFLNFSYNAVYSNMNFCYKLLSKILSSQVVLIIPSVIWNLSVLRVIDVLADM